MKPAPFAYHKARTLKEAVALLAKHKDDARLLAGGQSLIATLNMRLSAPSLLIDINGIKGLDYLVREVASFKLWSQAIQAMLQQTLNIETNLRTVVESVWFDDTRSGNFDLAIGAIVSTLLDPSDYFNAWYGKGGPQNYSNWDEPRFNALLPKIDSEVDPKKRLEYIRQAEMIMEENPPLLPMSWEKINDGWYSYVKGHNPREYFGIYDVVRFDTFWLDK